MFLKGAVVGDLQFLGHLVELRHVECLQLAHVDRFAVAAGFVSQFHVLHVLNGWCGGGLVSVGAQIFVPNGRRLCGSQSGGFFLS